jgi:hypothetical protein
MALDALVRRRRAEQVEEAADGGCGNEPWEFPLGRTLVRRSGANMTRCTRVFEERHVRAPSQSVFFAPFGSLACRKQTNKQKTRFFMRRGITSLAAPLIAAGAILKAKPTS